MLRGLLSLVHASADPERLVVFASNRVLSDRCDGIDERTLRRRILHLQESGLVVRKLSPNGKRYQVRNEDAEATLTYGIDLSPLFHIADHLEALAETTRREAVRKSMLRSLIRDILYHHAKSITPELCEQARLSLRRSLTSAQLESVIDTMKASLATDAEQGPAHAMELTASHSQNDRHILRSNKETHESEAAVSNDDCPERMRSPGPSEKVTADDITVDECVDLAQNAAELAERRPRTWTELIALSSQLAPAIGLSQTMVDTARLHLGAHGCALAIIGLVQAFDRIRNPQAYLTALTRRAQQHGLDAVRMFRSLARPARACLRHSG